MIIDLSAIVGLITLDTVIYGGLAFFAGMASVMVYSRLRSVARHDYRADEAVIEAVVLEYTRRLRDYDRVIADLRTKMDIMEIRSQPPPQEISRQIRQSRQPQPHVAPASEVVAVTQHVTIENAGGQNGTTDYILKLLAERPRTSREVQHAVGRTREHTARLMKKLHSLGLVNRDINNKPFRYTITDLGRERLKGKAASELPAV